MSRVVIAASGRTRPLPDHVDVALVAGLDEDGRIVVDTFNARARVNEPTEPGSLGAPFLFGLTLCCNAYDKGVEDGVVCRSCYSYEESGNYLYAVDGEFPGLDPIKEIQ